MSFPFTNYVSIKNRYCISYFGQCRDYIVLLRMLRPFIEKNFPELEIHLACEDMFFDLLEKENNVIKRTDFYECKRNYAYIRDINYKSNNQHPILELLQESEILIPVFERKNYEVKQCYIACEGMFPTGNVQKEFCINLAKREGYQITSDFENASWIIGVENEWLWQGVEKGKRVSLVNTGVGKELFQQIFPSGEVINILK